MSSRVFRLFGVAIPLVALALGTSAFAQQPPPKEEKKPEAKKEEPKKEEAKKDAKDIIAVATEAGCKEFVALVIQAGLADDLKKPGPLTVFVPTDEAFKKLGKDLDDLKKPENKEKLANVLKGHIVAKKVDAKVDKEAKPMHGDALKLAEKDGKLTVNEKIKVTKDVTASNGVVHLIDGVIMAAGGEKKPEAKKEEPKKEEKKPEAKKEEPKKEEPKKEEHKH